MFVFQANYTCSCPEGYEGPGLGNCTDINECDAQTYDCPFGGTCVNIPVSSFFICIEAEAPYFCQTLKLSHRQFGICCCDSRTAHGKQSNEVIN